VLTSSKSQATWRICVGHVAGACAGVVLFTPKQTWRRCHTEPRGGSWFNFSDSSSASFRNNLNPTGEGFAIGFRVANILEPSSLL
jgi:hypothetical protein